MIIIYWPIDQNLNDNIILINKSTGASLNNILAIPNILLIDNNEIFFLIFQPTSDCINIRSWVVDMIIRPFEEIEFKNIKSNGNSNCVGPGLYKI